MGTARFVARLEVAPGELASEGAPVSTLERLVVSVTRAHGRSTAPELFFHEMGQRVLDLPEAVVWLQVWEVDRIARRETSRSARNDLCVEIRGAIVQVADDPERFEFRALGPPLSPEGESRGWFTLALVDKNAASLGDSHLPIRGEWEAVVDLGCVLVDDASRDPAATESVEWNRSSLLHASNLAHVVGSMMEEGGLTIGFWANLNDAADLTALQRWQHAHPGARPSVAERRATSLREYGSGRTLYDVRNDREFRTAAELFARDFHSLGLASGEVTLACTPFVDDRFETVVQTTVNGVVEKVQAHAAWRSRQVKVKHLLVFTHGAPTGMRVSRTGETSGHREGRRRRFQAKIRAAQSRGDPEPVFTEDVGRWMQIPEIEGWLGPIAPKLTPDVVVSLFACSTAESGTSPDVDGEGGDGYGSFGLAPAAGTHLGDGGFAKAVWQFLHDHGCPDAVVWAHVIAAHTTRNATLRCFSARFAPENGKDMVWMVPGSSPPAEASARADAIHDFIGEWHGRSTQEFVQVSLLPPGAALDRILSRVHAERGSAGGSSGDDESED